MRILEDLETHKTSGSDWLPTVWHLLCGPLRILIRRTITCMTTPDRPIVSTWANPWSKVYICNKVFSELKIQEVFEKISQFYLGPTNDNPTSGKMVGIHSTFPFPSFKFFIKIQISGLWQILYFFERQPFRRLKLIATVCHLLCGSLRNEGLVTQNLQLRSITTVLESALRTLEDLETQNYNLQEYSGSAIGQRLS